MEWWWIVLIVILSLMLFPFIYKIACAFVWIYKDVYDEIREHFKDKKK